MAVHRLILTDRGEIHVHRWQPSCACGEWQSPGRRRKQEAVALHREHVDQVEHGKGRGTRNRRSPWRRPTPQDALPEALRSEDGETST